MKIQIISDLHLDNWRYETDEDMEKLVEPVGDVLVIAGDLAVDKNKLGAQFIDFYKSQFKSVIYIPGNHEHYGSWFVEENIQFHNIIDNTHYMNNAVVFVDNVRFLCSTLWSGVTKTAMNYINDYQCISGFDMIMENYVHAFSVGWLKRELMKKYSGPTVVVTHHLPLWECVSPRFVGNIANAAFVSDQSRLFDNSIDLWIHGHSHDYSEVTYKGISVVRNPCGYPHETLNFQNNFFKEV